MFKECAVRPERLDRSTPKSFVTTALAGIASVMLLLAVEPVAAKPNTEDTCRKKLQACSQRCSAREEDTQRFLNCITRTCNKQYDNCVKNSSTGTKAETPPGPRNPKGTDDRPRPTAGNKPEPNKPPKPRDHVPPTGGTKADPPKPPRADNPRAPMGGGVFQPTTSGSGSGSGGPIILRSTGAGSSTMNPGSNGAGMRSGKRH